jgi:signal transduction histidine kinase
MLTVVDLVKLVSSRKLLLESFATSKNVELIFTADCASYKTAIDELKIEKIVDNLISNAIKYSPANSRIIIELNARIRNGCLRCRILGLVSAKKRKAFVQRVLSGRQCH